MDTDSLKKMIDFQNDISGGLITPEISVEMDGTFSLTWYGENGSVIIAFPSEKEEVEYSYLGKNGDSDFGEFEDKDKFELLRKRAGVESLIKTQILKRK
jgi:hypothetical protein